MKALAPSTNTGRTMVRDDINHSTYDCGKAWRKATAKMCKRAYRKEAQKIILKELE